MYLTAFCDILGTKEMVMDDRFSDLHALDFSGAVALAAHDHPSARFAVFSDCVIFSIPADKCTTFIKILRYLWGSWLQDAIWVRGGIDVGEITWVDFSLDKTFQRYPNLSIARVYGQSVVGAYSIEQASGPGIVPFVTKAAANHIEIHEPGATLPLATHVLQFCEPEHFSYWTKWFSGPISRQISTNERRQVEATVRILELFKKQEGEQ
jgi:hypothetical protein